jgi:hypothetical protein
VKVRVLPRIVIYTTVRWEDITEDMRVVDSRVDGKSCFGMGLADDRIVIVVTALAVGDQLPAPP